MGGEPASRRIKKGSKKLTRGFIRPYGALRAGLEDDEEVHQLVKDLR